MHAPLNRLVNNLAKTVITINFTHLQTTVDKIQELTCFVNKMEPFQNALIPGGNRP